MCDTVDMFDHGLNSYESIYDIYIYYLNNTCIHMDFVCKTIDIPRESEGASEAGGQITMNYDTKADTTAICCLSCRSPNI